MIILVGLGVNVLIVVEKLLFGVPILNVVGVGGAKKDCKVNCVS